MYAYSGITRTLTSDTTGWPYTRLNRCRFYGADDGVRTRKPPAWQAGYLPIDIHPHDNKLLTFSRNLTCEPDRQFMVLAGLPLRLGSNYFG